MPTHEMRGGVRRAAFQRLAGNCNENEIAQRTSVDIFWAPCVQGAKLPRGDFVGGALQG